MKFYPSHPVIDAKIAEIRRKIRLSMNGIVSEQMEKMGISYKQNFGVSIPRLREIAKMYEPDYDLALRLWILDVREAKILATLLMPTDKMPEKIANEWLTDINNIELVEQVCMNLFYKLPYANTLCLEWIESLSDNVWEKICGFMLSVRIYSQLDKDGLKVIINEAFVNSSTENYHLYKSIALSLSRLIRAGEDIADIVFKKLLTISNSTLPGQKYIFHEVNEEIRFLKDL